MEGNANTLTRAEIADAIHCETGLSRIVAQRLTGSILVYMTAALCNGQSVKISGFGTFLLKEKNARIGRNPKTGAEAQITARRIVNFRPSGGLRDRVA